jgi:glutathione S-transferase/RNA polymerase-associated protein
VAACVKDIADMLAANANAMGDVAEMVEKGLFKREYRDHRLEWMIKAGGIEVVVKGLERDNIRFGPDFD